MPSTSAAWLTCGSNAACLDPAGYFSKQTIYREVHQKRTRVDESFERLLFQDPLTVFRNHARACGEAAPNSQASPPDPATPDSYAQRLPLRSIQPRHCSHVRPAISVRSMARLRQAAKAARHMTADRRREADRLS